MKLYKLYVVFAYLACFCTAAAMEGGVDIFQAARDGKTKRVKLLLTDNPDLVNAQEDSEWTPLYVASWHGKTETAAVLLQHKADVNAQESSGWTPLHRASFGGDTETVKLLLQHKADVNAQDKHERTSLYMASRWAHSEAAKLLLSYGAIPYSPINLFKEFLWFSKLYAQGHQAFINKVKKERDEVFWILYSIEYKKGGGRIMLPAELCDKIVELAFSGIKEWQQFKKAHPEIAELADTQEGKIS